MFPEVEGVNYHKSINSFSAVVWATPEDGYELEAGATTMWTFNLSPQNICSCELPLVDFSENSFGLAVDGTVWYNASKILAAS